MSKALKSITVWIAGTAVALTLAACSSTTGEESPAVTEPVAPSGVTQPAEPSDEGTTQEFTGEVATETITANNMDIQIPVGLKIPEGTLVTDAQAASIMMADEDATAVTEMFYASAEEAGYEVYADVPGGKVLVGNGNVLMFTSSPQAQLLTWGPEAMKDVLAGN